MSAYDDARRAYDGKTKPRGSLGRLEDLGCRLAAIRGYVPDRLEAAIVVAAGDHGVADEGVSAYPQEVTAQMVANFAAGGAAINVLARRAGAQLVVVDAGTAVPFEHELVRSVRIGAGTANMTLGPAMRAEQVERAFAAADALVGELDVDVVGLGEMGIANTTSASALTAALLGVDPLTALGGFEVAFLAGVVLACERRRLAVLLDGFITGAAALAAVRISPSAVDVMIAAHRSPEPGHAIVLEALGLEPLLELGLRLGEGSGAALALPLLQASVAILAEMATFGDAGVTDAGR